MLKNPNGLRALVVMCRLLKKPNAVSGVRSEWISFEFLEMWRAGVAGQPQKLTAPSLVALYFRGVKGDTNNIDDAERRATLASSLCAPLAQDCLLEHL